MSVLPIERQAPLLYIVSPCYNEEEARSCADFQAGKVELSTFDNKAAVSDRCLPMLINLRC